MNDKQQIISMLRDEFDRWEKSLGRLTEEQVAASRPIPEMSIKDIMAHLTAWQKISVARLEAARQDKEPEYPKLPDGLDPDAEDVDQINAWFLNSYREMPWSDIHQEWRKRYLRILELANAIPEKDILDSSRYTWQNGTALSAVLLGSYEHHQEHFEPLLAWLRQEGNL